MRWLASASASGSKRAVAAGRRQPDDHRRAADRRARRSPARSSRSGRSRRRRSRGPRHGSCRRDRVARVASTVSVAPTPRATSSLAGLMSTATIRAAPRQPRALDAPTARRRRSRSPRRSRPRAPRAVLLHGADAGRDRAADDGHDVERRVVADPDRARARDDDALGERRDAEVVVQAPPSPSLQRDVPSCSTPPGATTFGDQLALPRPPGRALAAARRTAAPRRGPRGRRAAGRRRPRRRA